MPFPCFEVSKYRKGYGRHFVARLPLTMGGPASKVLVATSKPTWMAAMMFICEPLQVFAISWLVRFDGPKSSFLLFQLIFDSTNEKGFVKVYLIGQDA